MIGIPMGTDCGPFLANLYLFALEFKWIEKKSKEDLAAARKFRHSFRYIDDLAVMNGKDLSEHFLEIYGDDLRLERQNEHDWKANFLDLNLVVNDKQFILSIYDKRDAFPFNIVSFPQLSGNIHTRNAHGVFVGQLLRFARGSTQPHFFFYRTHNLAHKLIKQGFSARRLYQLACRFFEEREHLARRFAPSMPLFAQYCMSGYPHAQGRSSHRAHS